MNLAAMEAMLRKRVNNPTEADQSKTVMYDCLNLGYEDLCDRFNFRQVRNRLRFETNSSNNIYQLPSDWYEVIHVRYADSDDRGGRLTKAAPNQTFDLDSASQPGRPTHYALWVNDLQLYPPPDTAYAIEVFAKVKPAPLVSPGDVPVISPSWHYGVVLLARWYYFDGGGVTNPAAAGSAMQSFTVWAAGRPVPAVEELDDLEQAVEVPTLGRWSVNGRRGDLPPDVWRTGGM